jgi:hypothetical protein
LRKVLLGGRGRFDRLDEQTVHKLRLHYRAEVERVEGLLGIDLAAWKQ